MIRMTIIDILKELMPQELSLEYDYDYNKLVIKASLSIKQSEKEIGVEMVCK